MAKPAVVNAKNQFPNNTSDWWKGGVIYQIYPRSYQDTSGDGVGDLAGITSRLPYIASLGVDAIWISPFFQSPMKDYGYDVSDYRAIDPMFGSMDDFDALLSRAHELGLRIMVDLVLSHTSNEHPWFVQSRADRSNPKSDWYVWADANEDGTPPNNWLAIFGGSAWQWDSAREQYFLHNFLTTQPDLNVHNKEVQDELLDVAKFWLDKGVDGFRLDTINFYMHDTKLRNNPALPVEKRNASIAPSVNPYNWQDHLYSKNQPENLLFLERLRSLTDQYDGRACLGEVGDAQRGLQIMGEYTKGNKRMHMCYAFEFLESKPATAHWVKAVFDKLNDEAPNSWPCWAFSNHDVKRVASRWQATQEASQAYALLLHAMLGSVCIYQGEELGLTEADIQFEDLQDPYGVEFWPTFKGRDGCRTPMVWEQNSKNAGFGDAKPWLPVSNDHLASAVDVQEQDESSLLHHFRKCIAIRKALPVLQDGEQLDMQIQGDVLSFVRKNDQGQWLCVFNLSDTAQAFVMPAGDWQTLEVDLGANFGDVTSANLMAPWQYCIAKKC